MLHSKFFSLTTIRLTLALLLLSQFSAKSLNDSLKTNEYTFNFIKLWGEIKYKTSKSATKNLNFDELFIRYYGKIKATHSKTNFNEIIFEFLNEIKKTKIYEIKKTIVIPLSNDTNVYNSENLTYINKIKSKNFVKKNLYFDRVLFINNFRLNENSYEKEEFPSEGKRILSLARLWTTLNFFYAYKENLVINIDSLFISYIPIAENCKDKYEYNYMFLNISHFFNDTHVTVFSNTIFYNIFGKYLPPFKTIYVDSQLIVKEVFDKKISIKKGDQIIKLEKYDVRFLIDSLKSKLSYSNINSYYNIVNHYMLRTKEAVHFIKFLRNGISDSCEIKNIIYSRYFDVIDSIERSLPLFSIKNKETIYLRICAIKKNELNKYLHMSEGYKNIILDLRGYPKQTIYKTVNFFSNSKKKFAKIKTPKKHGLGKFNDSLFYYCGKNRIYKKNTKKIYLLVDNTTQSQAEFMAMGIQTLENVTTVGNQTAGADGDVFHVRLPGGIKMYFSGLDISYPNGIRTQNSGIKIDKYIRYNLLDLVKFKDTILEYVMRLIDNDDGEKNNREN